MSEEQDAAPEAPEGHATDNFVSENRDTESVPVEAETVAPVEETTPDAPEEVSETESEATEEAENETAAEPEEKKGDDTPAETEPPEQKKGKNKTQKRINDLTRKAGDANRRAEKAEKRISEMEAEAAENKPLPEPDIKDFPEYEDFIEAREKYENAMENPKTKVEEVKKVDPEPESDEVKLTDSQKTALEVVKENLNSNESKPDDFDEVVHNNNDLQLTPEMIEALAECDDPAKVAYALGKDTDLSREIAGKTPAQQAREMAKLDMAVESKPSVKPVLASKAPDPITPVGGSDAQDTPISKMTYSEYEKVQNARERKQTSAY